MRRRARTTSRRRRYRAARIPQSFAANRRSGSRDREREKPACPVRMGFQARPSPVAFPPDRSGDRAFWRSVLVDQIGLGLAPSLFSCSSRLSARIPRGSNADPEAGHSKPVFWTAKNTDGRGNDTGKNEGMLHRTLREITVRNQGHEGEERRHTPSLSSPDSVRSILFKRPNLDVAKPQVVAVVL